MSRPDHAERLRRNALSKLRAEHDGETWADDDLEWLESWDGSEEYLAELSELLGRTIEACREQFYKRRRLGQWVQVTTTVTTTTVTTYREACPRCFLIHATTQQDCE